MARRSAACRRRREQLAHDLPGFVEYLEAAGWPDLDAELEALVDPLHRSPSPPTPARVAGAHFDFTEVDRFIRFCLKLRHVKGKWARRPAKPFLPDLWQLVFVVAPLLGWKRADGTRYYRELYLEVPRKNGKSTLAAVLTLWLLIGDGEPGAEVYSLALDKGQARAVFNVSAEMALGSRALRRRLRILKRSGELLHERSGSVYKVLSSDRRGKRKHGLNVHGAVIDELHVITDGELLEVVETGTGSRTQPLIIKITTAGDPDENPLWRDTRKDAVNVADGVVERPELLAVIFAAPKEEVLKVPAGKPGAWDDPEVWKAANPGYGRSVFPEYLAGKAKAARSSPAKRNAFCRLHLGIPTSTSAGWLDGDVWDRSASIVDEADLKGASCWAGLDLSSSLDLSAFVMVFPDADGRVLDVVCRFWTPADTLAERAERDFADYARWVEEGWLTAVPGETLDYDLIERDVKADLRRFEVEGLNYDPWGAKQLRDHLDEAGAPLWDCAQTYAVLSPATKEATKLIVDGRLRHGGHPVLRWCVANTLLVEDGNGNVKPDRKRSTGRIDGSVALIMAIEAWLRDTAGGTSAYDEEQGVEVV